MKNNSAGDLSFDLSSPSTSALTPQTFIKLLMLHSEDKEYCRRCGETDVAVDTICISIPAQVAMPDLGLTVVDGQILHARELSFCPACQEYEMMAGSACEIVLRSASANSVNFSPSVVVDQTASVNETCASVA